MAARFWERAYLLFNLEKPPGGDASPAAAAVAAAAATDAKAGVGVEDAARGGGL